MQSIQIKLLNCLKRAKRLLSTQKNSELKESLDEIENLVKALLRGDS
jgi:hypothetical protein